MFSADTLNNVVNQLKGLQLPNLKEDEIKDLMQCVSTLEVATISITEAYMVLQELDSKVTTPAEDPTVDPDISYLIKAYTELNAKLLNGNREKTEKYLNSLKVTLTSVITVFKYINSFPGLLAENAEVPEKKIILLN